jgi:hypothetical protein
VIKYVVNKIGSIPIRATIHLKDKIMSVLSAWRKGDLVRMPNGDEFRLTSEGYYCEQKQKVICDTDRGKPISYLKLIEIAWLVETGSGRKNEILK